MHDRCCFKVHIPGTCFTKYCRLQRFIRAGHTNEFIEPGAQRRTVEYQLQGCFAVGGNTRLPDFPEQQVWQIAAYVRSMSGQLRKDVAPGRSDSLSAQPSEQRTPQAEPRGSGIPPASEGRQ